MSMRKRLITIRINTAIKYKNEANDSSFNDEHVHEKVFNDRIAELLALFVIKESALYFEGLLLF